MIASQLFTVRNGSFASWDIMEEGEEFTTPFGDRHSELWKAECQMEQDLKNAGFQVFFSIEEAEEFLREIG